MEREAARVGVGGGGARKGASCTSEKGTEGEKKDARGRKRKRGWSLGIVKRFVDSDSVQNREGKLEETQWKSRNGGERLGTAKNPEQE